MSVLHPGLLAAGIAAVAIPIVIHLLLRRRRKPIKWAAMRFLLEAYQKQRRKLKLQQWLLLIARCLLVVLVGIALARPLVQSGVLAGGSAGRTVYLVIDNSIASGVRAAAGGTALDRHKQAASEVLSGLGPGDRVALVTLAGPAAGVVLPASADPAAVRRIVEGLEPLDSGADLRRAFELVGSDARSSADAGKSASVVVLSDFLEGAVDLSAPLPAALAGLDDVRVIASSPVASAPENMQIVSVEPIWDDPGDLRPGQVSVRVRRVGAAVSEAVSRRVRVFGHAERGLGVGGAHQKPLADGVVRLARGAQEALAPLVLDREQLDPGQASGQLVLTAELEGDDLPADDERRVVVPLRDSLRVGLVAQRRFGAQRMTDFRASDWIRIALTPLLSVPIEVVDLNPAVLDAPQLAQVDVLIVAEPHLVQDAGWGQMRRLVDRGGLVLVCPPTDANIHLWTDSFERAFDLPVRLAREATTFAAPVRVVPAETTSGVLRLIKGELPELVRPVTVSKALPLESEEGVFETLFAMEQGQPWMISMRAGHIEEQQASGGGGLVLYLASSPDPAWTNLPLMPLMVPLLQETLRQGIAESGSRATTVVAGEAFVPALGVRELVLEREGEPIHASASVGGGMTLRRAGVWRGVDEQGLRGVEIASNPDADGARTGVVDAGALRAWLAGASGVGADPVTSVQWLDGEGSSEGIGQRATRSPFDLPLLLGVLALVLVEMVLARWASHAGPWRMGRGVRDASERQAA
ncbi:MAG: BatA domain-containing protein [Phycisphaerales bacterium]|nr:BatA domain-containing protein [Phycisphaerales bacterium]